VSEAAQIAVVTYGLVMLTNLTHLGVLIHGGSGLRWAEGLMLVVAIAASVMLGRPVLAWLRLPNLTLRGSLTAVAALAVAYLSARALGLAVPISDSQMLAEYRLQPHGLLVALLVVAGFVPLLEEWLFRGIILECLLALFPRHAAVAATALLFAILHLTPATIVHHGLVGYVCGRVRLGTGSLWPAVLCHSVYNGAVVLLAW